MSDDESFFLFALGIPALVIGFMWYRRVLGVKDLEGHRVARLPLLALPVACLVFLWVVLSVYADDEVRGNIGYKLLFTGAWVVGLYFMRAVGWTLAGIDAIGQGLERRNPAALWAAAGMWVATTLVMAGSNIGEGPTIYTTLGPGCVGLLALAALWGALDMFTSNGHAIAVDRDRAAGCRLAGWLVAWGLVLARAVAGDWESSAAMVRDFNAAAWPTLVMLALAVGIEWLLRPTPVAPQRPVVPAGLWPALLGLSAALVWVAWLGGWDGQPWHLTLQGPP